MGLIYEEYLAHQEEAVRRYGEGTVCFMEVGSFYEVYSMDETWARRLADQLSVTLTMKNKGQPLSAQNPFLVGFPSHALDKYLQGLIADGRSVCLVTQSRNQSLAGNGNGRMTRELSDVITPSTYIPPGSDDDSARNLVVMLISQHREYRTGKRYRSLACASSDPTAGRNVSVYENVNVQKDDAILADDIVRIVLALRPAEMFVLTEDDDNSVTGFEFSPARPTFQKVPSEMLDRDHREALLNKVYPGAKASALTGSEYAGTERSVTLEVALCCLLEKMYQFNPAPLQDPPEVQLEPEHGALVLENSAFEQLDVPELCRMLNCAKTPMGRRLFRERLARPWCDTEKIIQAQQEVREQISHETWKQTRASMSGIRDIERYACLVHRGRATPKDLSLFIHSVDESCKVMGMDMDPLAKMKSMLNVDALLLETNVIAEGVSQELDKAASEYAISTEWPVAFAKALNTAVGCSDHFKVESTERDGPAVIVTNKRWKDAKATVASNNVMEILLSNNQAIPVHFGDITTTTAGSSTKCKVTCPALTKVLDRLPAVRDRFRTLHAKVYARVLSEGFGSEASSQVATLSAQLARLDVAAAGARNANELCHCIPQIQSAATGFIDIKAVRHPLIEGIERRKLCVPNDVRLGRCADDHGVNGMLLYGINSAGKSSLMKSVGLAVIMAQAGMPVAASAMVLSPYTRLFTRIEKSDNLLRGHSTFVVEMLEFRNIQRLADARSLVIGDELCSGTEHVSAVSIVAAGIEDIASRGSTFVFASHLHTLADIPIVSELPNLIVRHLATTIDPDTCQLIHDRMLREGSGPSCYGLTVCRSLDMNPAFLRRAEEVRKQLCGEQATLVSTRRSHYNARKIIDVCEECMQKPAQEVHHVRQQKDAKHGKIDGRFSVHNLENLRALCEQCHDRIHLQSQSQSQ